MTRRICAVVLMAMGAVVLTGALPGCGSNNSMNDAGGGAGGNAAPGNGGSSGSSTAAACHEAGTLQVTATSSAAYIIDGASNPTLTLCRGRTYTFAVNATGHPFYIKTVKSTGTANAYETGVAGNGADVGDVTFAVPADAPATLFYDCSIHAAMAGTIQIVD